MTCSGPVSIVSLLIVTLLPLLCSAFAVYISRSWLLFFIAFIKAFLLGFTALGIYAAFGSSGWVFRFFLMFSDLGMLPFLYLFWLQHLPGGCGICRRDSMFLLCGMAIAGIDYAFISPFWAGL